MGYTGLKLLFGLKLPKKLLESCNIVEFDFLKH